jgi:hypothetical protein
MPYLRERALMTGRGEISGNERFDFYGGHYGRFHGELAAEVRCEVYGEDLGQTGWRTAAEQAEIAHHLRLGPDSSVIDILRFRRPVAGAGRAHGMSNYRRRYRAHSN